MKKHGLIWTQRAQGNGGKTSGARTVPQITIDGKWIGGFSELTMMHMDDELDELVEA